MKSSSNVFKRARPAFGTILRIELDVDQPQIFSRAFALAEELEQCLSKFRPDSDLNRLNFAAVDTELEIAPALGEVLALALDLHHTTLEGFTPYSSGCGNILMRTEGERWFATKLASCTLDLSGIAKGYAVDQICALIRTELPNVSGVVNAGGDLRFINSADREILVRGTSSTFELRKLKVSYDSAATSSFTECRGNPLSSTVYPLTPRKDLDEGCSVTVMAANCALADALTKVVWFGGEDITLKCVKKYDAQVLILNSRGDVHRQYA